MASLPEHVLVVEDNMIIAMDLEDSIRRLGVGSVAIEGSVETALAAIETRLPDFAIIDFNLGDETSEPIAHALKERGVRFVLATGYSEMKDRLEELGAAGVLHKPFGQRDLKAALLGEGATN